ncbi:MAG: sigma-70 family RNA polymerase sigma factor [Verrucomicrobiaceae bacterium]|nr:sigma-70 family RNA polymerase sigma factor [Verrucomicrobiaceae bacterium]
MPDTQASADRIFPPTAWTLVLAASETEVAREQLCGAYWPPVARFLRSLGLSDQDAEDGAQEIMTKLMAQDGLAQIDRSKGMLRHYLKAAARHYLFNLHRDAGAKKRGGGQNTISLDDVDHMPAPASVSDALFDQAWALTICERAMQALEASCARRGKAALFSALKPALTLGDELQRYADIGAMFGVNEKQIRIEVHRLRRRLAEFLRAEVAATMAHGTSDSELEEETRYLVRTLAHEPRS